MFIINVISRLTRNDIVISKQLPFTMYCQKCVCNICEIIYYEFRKFSYTSKYTVFSQLFRATKEMYLL